MSRYYILTEHDGVGVVEANTVDESLPFTIRFVADAGIKEFDRNELLWWAPVESAAPAPFANFGRSHHAPAFGGSSARSPLQSPFAPMRAAQTNADFSRRSAAAMRALVDAARKGVPRGWKSAVLELKVTYELPADRYKVTHRLRSPGSDAEAFDFSDTLIIAIEVFHRIAAEGGQHWNRSTLTFHLDDNGRWIEAEAKYDYATNFGPR